MRALANKSSIVVLSIIIFFFLLEGAIRLRSYIKHGEGLSQQGIYYQDPELGNLPRPGAIKIGKSSKISINRWGFRGEDFDKTKKQNEIRIFTLGSSETFGRYAADDNLAWTSQLQTVLNSTNNGKFYRIINAGVPGFNLNKIRLYIEKRILDYDPDVFLIYQATNDINNICKSIYGNGETNKTKPNLIKQVRENHFLWYQILKYETTGIFGNKNHQERNDRIDDRGIEEFRKRLKEVVGLAKKKNIKIVLATVARSFREEQPESYQARMASSMMVFNPYLSLKGLNHAFNSFNDEIRRVSKQENVLLIDCDEDFINESSIFRDHVHFNHEGHKRIAEYLAEKLLSSKL